MPPLEVVEEPPPLADEHEQPAPRVMVVAVGPEVLGEVVDARREQRYLHLGRARIGLRLPELLDDFALRLDGQAHRRRTVARTCSTSWCICGTSARIGVEDTACPSTSS